MVAALLLLLGSATPALARMTCVSSGHSVLNIGQVRDCCPVDHSHPMPQVKATCCELVKAQPQRSAFVAGAAAELPVLDAPLIGILSAVPDVRPGHVHRIIVAARPPTLIGRRLAAIGLLLL